MLFFIEVNEFEKFVCKIRDNLFQAQKFEIEYHNFRSRKCIWQIRVQKCWAFCTDPNALMELSIMEECHANTKIGLRMVHSMVSWSDI